MDSQPRRLHRLAGIAFPGLLGVLAFLLACRGFIDPDFWWHLKAGQWILEQRQVPNLDPLTFGSADRPWIDLHWLYQCSLAVVHAAGGVRAVVVGHALIAAICVFLAFACRSRKSSAAISALCWVPALLVAANRFLIRPEQLTLLYLAVFLVVIVHAELKPQLLWILPFVQLVWVNSHGLFIFGPLVLGLWILSQFLETRLAQVRPPLSLGEQDRIRWWKRIGIVTALVGLACFLNPYSVRGALFPLELYAKVTSGDNPYKQRIWEFQTPAVYFLSELKEHALTGVPVTVSTSFWFRFLLLMMPLGFVIPAASRMEQDAGQTRVSPRIWTILLGIGGVLALSGSALAYGEACPGWIVQFGQSLPALFALMGVAGACVLFVRKAPAAALILAGSVALACWAEWLNLYFSGTTLQGLPPLGPVGWLGMGAALFASYQIVRSGGDLFAMLLSVVFGYLALNAINSLGRFGLVSGVALCSAISNWGEATAGTPGEEAPQRRSGLAFPGAVGLGFTCWIVAAISGVSQLPRAWTADALGEPVLAAPHDAARFAGQTGMPDRALVFGLPAANLYVYYNAPERRPFMDARLEVPSLDTFQAYVAAEKRFLSGTPDWPQNVEAIGAPLLMFTHDKYHAGEAAVLAHPDWRLVEFDALAGVYIRRGDHDAKIPTLDLGTRHFLAPESASIPHAPGAARLETVALVNIGTALARQPELAWSHRIPILLSAFDRAELAIKEEPDAVGVWTVLGNACWAMTPNLRTPPPQSGDPWDPQRSLRWAQQTYCLRQAQQLAPTDIRVLNELHRSFAARKMIDSMRTVGEDLLATGKLPSPQADEIASVNARVGPPGEFPPLSAEQARDLTIRLLQAGRPEDATFLADRVGDSAWSSWPAPLIDQVAGAHLQLGAPARAREIWASTTSLAESDRLLRFAATAWVERNFTGATEFARKARELDQRSPVACWMLAWLLTEQGRADEALRSIDDTPSLPEETRREVDHLRAMLLRYARSSTAAGR